MSDEKSLREVSERGVHWLRNSTYLQYARGHAKGDITVKINDALVHVIDANGRVRRDGRFLRLWRWLSN